jgi:uncharacterized protein YdeI (YjbR/CyaY-like superfamily)
MNLVFFNTAAAFRSWLQTNHSQSSELWLGLHKKQSGRPSVTYSDALDEALCFGWIDGVRQSINSGSYRIRFTPRKAKSQWSAVNIRRVAQLIAAGRMMAAGLKAFEPAKDQHRTYSYEQRNAAKFTAADNRRFRSVRNAWDFFQSQPPWYRRTSTFWVISAKRPETRERRLDSLIEHCRNQRTLPALTRPARTRTLLTRKAAVPKR